MTNLLDRVYICNNLIVTITYSDGAIYTGTLIDNKKNGEGN